MRVAHPATNLWLDRAAPPLAAALHVALALLLKERGFTIILWKVSSSWDWLWQTLPAAALRENMWQSIWYLHMQPPVYNLWGAFWLRLFPGHVMPLHAMHYGHIVLGALICAMTYAIARAMRLGRWASAAASWLVALLPALLLYEAYALYEVLCLFFLTATVWGVSHYEQAQRCNWLLLAVAALTLLVLTRSAYHLALLGPVIGVLALALPARRLRFVLLACLVALPALGWYAKNQVQFGFFGASSWGGMNLWRIAPAPGPETDALLAAGVIGPVAAHLPAFSLPSQYAPYGFTATGRVPVLNADDHNNVNMVAVAREYGRSARNMILHSPRRYMANVAAAFAFFIQPSAAYRHLDANRARMPLPWQWAVAVEALLRPTAVVLPASLLLFVLLAALHLRRGKTLAGFVQQWPTATLVAGLILYSTLVSVTLEIQENMRFRFTVEPLIWLFFVGMSVAVVRELRWAPSEALRLEQTKG